MKRKINKENIEEKKEGKVFVYGAVLLLLVILLQVALFLFNLEHNLFSVHIIITLLLFVFTIWHATMKKGWKNALIFLFLSIIISFFAEFIGVNFGSVFGGAYSYSKMFGVTIGNVPVVVILMWASIIYISYMVSEHILNYRFAGKFKFWRRLELSFFSSIIAALATVAWDFMLDPIAVINEWWIWNYGGVYFQNIAGGIPLSNFIGWMIVAFIVVFVFKLFFETKHAEKETAYDFAPVLIYALLYISTASLSFKTQQPIFALIGFVTMGPFIIISLVRYLSVRYKLPHNYKDQV